MRAPRYKPVRRYGFNMTPMIDVVFLLIIFFLVSSHLAKQENQLQLKLPVAQSGNNDVQQDVPRVTVNVKQDGTLWVRGQEVSKGDLEPLLAKAKTAEPDEAVEVRIRGSRMAPYSSVEPVMVACAKTGIWNVTYAVYRDDVQ